MPNFTLLEQLAFSLGLFNLSTNKPINFTTKPSPFSRVLYNEVLEIQKDLQLLYYNLSKDLDSYSFEDDFYNFLKSIRSPDKNKKIVAFYLRSDYLLDYIGLGNDEGGSKVGNGSSKVDEGSLNEDPNLNNLNNNNSPFNLNSYIYKQVEINTISQCFSFFGPILNKIHSRFYPNTLISDSDLKFINFLLFLNEQYFKIYKSKGIIAMIDNDTTPLSKNFLEKMKIIEMCNLKGIEMIHIKINEIIIDNNKVYYKNKLISIIYYRWFYNFDHFNEESKILRKKIENCEVINLPSAEFQMINSKGFQKILKNEKNLKKYTKKVKKIKKHFGEFRDVYKGKVEGDDEDCGVEGKEVGGKGDSKVEGKNVHNPLTTLLPNNNTPPNFIIPQGWILKDINEGGGHLNKSLNSSSFLMKKFKSPSYPGSFISDLKERNLISELSIFGGFVAVNGEIKFNEEGGYMVRSKDEGSLEGGVCIGKGGLDSICFE